MSPFWRGFFNIFGGSLTPRHKIKPPEPFKWYHDGPWYEHPIYDNAFKKKDQD